MMQPPAPCRRARNDGFIVVTVLWVLAALTALVTVYSRYLHATVPVFLVQDDQLRAQALELAGVELAVYRLTAVPGVRPPLGELSFQLGGADVAVVFRSEAARIDLNFAPKEVLAGLFAEFGAKIDDANRFAERVIGWRTPLSEGATNNEELLYQEAKRPYGPRRGHFQHVDELALVLGAPPELVGRVLPYLTVFSGQAEINALGAAREVLAAVPRMTPERMQALLVQRGEATQETLNAQLGPIAQYITTRGSNANRVSVDVRWGGDREFRAEAVVLILNDDAQPYRVLSWNDRIAGTPGSTGP